MKIKIAAVAKPSAKLERLLTLKRRTELFKNTYNEIDELTMELSKEKLPELVVFRGKVKKLEIVDNYSDKNSAWGHASVRRFEIKVKDVSEKKKEK